MKLERVVSLDCLLLQSKYPTHKNGLAITSIEVVSPESVKLCLNLPKSRPKSPNKLALAT